MKILFTGASGFLGRYAAPRLARDHEVIGTYGQDDAPIEGVSLVRLDLEDVAACRALMDSVKPDLVVHAAAISRPGPCEADPERAERVNVQATRVLAEASKQIIFYSTDLVYGGTDGPYRETDPVSPISKYGCTKVDAEQAVLDSCEKSLVLRFATGYGWKRTGHTMFCDQLYANIRSGEGMDLYRDQVRSFIYLKDAAEILSRLVSKPAWPSGRDRIFNCGGLETMSRLRFGRLFCEGLRLDDTKIRETTIEAAGVNSPKDCSLNSSRLHEFTGFQPGTVQKGVSDMALEIPKGSRKKN